jgi:hypothetical protein
MSGQSVDALAYSYIKNNLTLNQMESYPLLGSITVPEPTNPDGGFTDLLSNTTIKRACCVGYASLDGSDSYQVKVRIPVPKNYDVKSTINATLSGKFGYIDKVINIPTSMCPSGYKKKTNQCDNFMEVYCDNVYQMYKNEIKSLGTTYSDKEFATLKPECACYTDRPSYIGTGISPQCYATNCGGATNGSYLSSSVLPCTAVMCNQIFDTHDMKVGGNVNINVASEQACGSEYTGGITTKQVDGKTTASGGSVTPSTGSNNPTGYDKPAVDKLAVNKPTVDKPAVDKPAVDKPAVDKPAVADKSVTSGKSNVVNAPIASDLPADKSTGNVLSNSFTASGNYIGWILIVVCIVLLMSSSAFFLLR